MLVRSLSPVLNLRGLKDLVLVHPSVSCATYTYPLPPGFSVVRIMPPHPGEVSGGRSGSGRRNPR